MKELTTEARILDGALTLFYKHGIKSITMDDIARQLGMSKKTIYRFFRDKEEMVLKCCDRDLHDRDCMFREITGASTDAIGELMEMMKHMGKMFSQMNPNLFYDMQKYHPAAYKMFRDFKEKNILRMVEDNLRKGIGQGLYRRDINIPVIARLRIEEVEMGMNPHLFPAQVFRLADVQLAIFDHFMHGITTLKGHKLINKYKQITEEE
jgi:AcrR family transcriptional regulator